MTVQFHPGGMTRLLPNGSGSITHWHGGGGGGGRGITDVSTALAQPGQFANAFANTFGGYGQGMAGIANAYGNVGAAAHGAAGQAEAARQLAAGNIANQSLAAYGGMGNAAMAAWAQNQSAYNQALSGMFGANQVAASQLGQSRNQALSGLGQSVAALGGRLGAANVVADMDFGGGGSMGSGFQATGPGGPIASGSFGGGGLGGGGGGSRQPGPGLGAVTDRGFSALDALRGDINDNTYLNNLTEGRNAGMSQLDAQHYSSRNRPFQFMGQALGGLSQLGNAGYDALAGGMDQFYRQNTGSGALDGIGSAMNNLVGGFGTTNRNIQRMWDNSLAKLRLFQTPLERAQANEALRRYQGSLRGR